jgi:hypothetical protein
VDVTTLGDVRKRDVLGHQEDHGARGFSLEPDARRQLLGERDALGDVAVPLALADVVQEHAQHQKVGPLDLVEHLGNPLGGGGGARRERLEILHGDERVLVRRELVIDVVLDEAGQRVPLGQVAPEKAHLVHLAKRLRHPSPVAADVEEELARLRRAAEAVVHEVEGLLDRPPMSTLTQPQAVGVPEGLHQPRGLRAEISPSGGRGVGAVHHEECRRASRRRRRRTVPPRESVLAARDQAARLGGSRAWRQSRINFSTSSETSSP